MSGDRAAEQAARPNVVCRPEMSWGAVTHVGGVRDHNEDAFFVGDDVCVVADGMGGHEAGEVASRIVTTMVSEAFRGGRLDVTALPGLVTGLNDAIRTTADRNETRGMGTTVVGVALVDNGDDESAIVFHVGDSRCYRVRDGVMTQLTTDHSHVQELLAAGRIRADQVGSHPLRNVITRALGADDVVEADFLVLPDEDCRLLLCSDGLSGELDDERIAELLTSSSDPSHAAETLLDAALAGTARDNVTAVVVDLRFRRNDAEDLADDRPGRRSVADVTAEIGAGDGPTGDVDDASVVGRPPTGPDAAAWVDTNTN